MRILIDTEAGTLTAGQLEHALYSPEAFQTISRLWLQLGWNLGHWSTFSWLGRQCLQFPDDLLRLAEAVWRLRPDVIVETGVYDGGTTLLFATLCRMRGSGRVIGVDSELRPGLREAMPPEVTLIEGDSVSSRVVDTVRGAIRPGDRVFVFLDSDHDREHVTRELEAYAPLVSPGSYIVVADTIMEELAGMPEARPDWRQDNPAPAVASFLKTHPEFASQTPGPLFATRADFTGLTYFPGGWLKRLP